MTNNSKQFTSITSFVSHTASSKDIRFPEKQLTLYCRENDCSFQKVINIFNSYYEKFKWSYDNFNELILILCLAVKKIDLKSTFQNPKMKQETQTVLKKSLTFLEDIITSKMLLACLRFKNNQNSITQTFLYTKGFINLLVPQLLALEFYNSIIDLLQKSNNKSKSGRLVGINFLVEYIFVSVIIDHLSQQSEDSFKFIVLDLLEEKKQFIFHLLWSAQNHKDNQLDFKQIACLRLDVQSPENYSIKLTNQGKLVPIKNLNILHESWIVDAYQKRPNVLIWRGINLKTVLDIYQFLFKLQVFASSPQISDLDSLIANNDEFLEIFSKFLMGQNLLEVNRKKNGDSRNEKQDQDTILKDLSEIKKLLKKVDKPYKEIFHKEVIKFFDQSSDNSEKEKQK